MRHMRHPTRWLITPHPALETNQGADKPISIDVEQASSGAVGFKWTDRTNSGHVRPVSAPHADGQTRTTP